MDVAIWKGRFLCVESDDHRQMLFNGPVRDSAKYHQLVQTKKDPIK